MFVWRRGTWEYNEQKLFARLQEVKWKKRLNARRDTRVKVY